MEDTIKKIIEFDENARKTVEEANQKKENIENYIKQEITIKKGVYEDKINQDIKEKQDGYTKDIKEKEKEKLKQFEEEKQKLQAKFYEEKEETKKQILNKILGEGE